MPKSATLDIRPLREANGPVSVLARAIEVAPGGVDDLIEALRQGMPLYEGDGTYLGSLADLMTARRLKELETGATTTLKAAAG